MTTQSFYDRHPRIASALIVVWVIAGGIPLVAMIWPDFACMLGASDLWCNERATTKN